MTRVPESNRSLWPRGGMGLQREAEKTFLKEPLVQPTLPALSSAALGQPQGPADRDEQMWFGAGAGGRGAASGLSGGVSTKTRLEGEKVEDPGALTTPEETTNPGGVWVQRERRRGPPAEHWAGLVP